MEIEYIGIRPVNKYTKDTSIISMIAIFSNYFINPGTLVTSGMMIVAGIPFWVTVFSQTIAAFIGMIPLIIFTKPGIDHSIPGQVVCRAIFGIRGSRWITSLLRVICSIYWYAFQTLASSLTITALLKHFLGLSISLQIIAILLSILQLTIAIFGFKYLKLLSFVSLPFKLFSFTLLIIWLIYNKDISNKPILFNISLTHINWIILAGWINAIIVSGFTMTADASDFTRYSSSYHRVISGIFFGIIFGVFLASFFAAYCVSIEGNNINPFYVFINFHANYLILLIIILLVTFDTWTINVINLYSGGLSLCNMFENISRVKSTFVIGVITILLLLIPNILKNYVNTISEIGGLFSPVSGIIVAWMISEYKFLSLKDLYTSSNSKYWYQKGYNVRAIIFIIIGLFLNSIILKFIPGFLTAILILALVLLCNNLKHPIFSRINKLTHEDKISIY